MYPFIGIPGNVAAWLEPLLIFILCAIYIVTIISILKNGNLRLMSKLLWVILVLFIPILGVLIYWLYNKLSFSKDSIVS